MNDRPQGWAPFTPGESKGPNPAADAGADSDDFIGGPRVKTDEQLAQ